MTNSLHDLVVRPVLSLFPGIGLLDHAFELEGFTVFRGPDILWGGDVRNFHAMPGVFDGLIGGPPCQAHSAASAIRGTHKVDLIPEFVRVFHEAKPKWVVMENVRGALGHEAIPADWQPVQLRDFDCGGETARVRFFWTWPTWTLSPAARPGQAQHSVMATTWKRGSSDSQYVKDKGFLPGGLPVEEYARLQGAPEIGARLIEHGCGKRYAVHVLGNGVPVPMGRYMARAIADGMYSHNAALTGGDSRTVERRCSALALARQFHAIYERLAPSFGYETRQETRDFDPDSPNGRLMVAVCTEIIEQNADLTGKQKPEKEVEA